MRRNSLGRANGPGNKTARPSLTFVTEKEYTSGIYYSAYGRGGVTHVHFNAITASCR